MNANRPGEVASWRILSQLSNRTTLLVVIERGAGYTAIEAFAYRQLICTWASLCSVSQWSLVIGKQS